MQKPAQALHERALQLHREGRLAEAERLYRDILQASPRDVQALHMLGVLKLTQDQPSEAVALIGAAVEIDPRSAGALADHGVALAAVGRLQEAVDRYDQALTIDPRNADVLQVRGDALCDLRRADEALASYDKAIAIEPRHVAALVNRGLLLTELGRPGEALASYEKAVAADPGDCVAWNNRGLVLQDLERHAEALASFERALRLAPDYPDALINHANALLTLRRPAEAIAGYARALRQRPDLAAVHIARGHAFADLGRFEEALQSCEQALAIDGSLTEARINRARMLVKLGRYHEASAEYRRLHASKPDYPHLLAELAHCEANGCLWSDMPRWQAELVRAVEAGVAPVDPFVLLGFEASPQQQLASARSWLASKKLTAARRDWSPAEYASDRIRVAYLSADYHRHVTAYVMAELFELHDRTRFETIGISFGPDDGSPIRSRLVKSFDRFFDVSSRLDADVASLLRDLKVHIAVDLKGHTTDSRIGILAQRAAPIQVSYMGFPATTGADFIDYLIADRVVVPPAHEPFYAERIVYLPDCYYVTDRQRPVSARIPSRGETGLPEQGFVFCCFNNSWKINAGMFDIWMRLLRVVEGSVLWLFGVNPLATDNLRREAQARGVEAARLVFAPPVELADHLARASLADIVLDTLPYNAHTTATDALWLGVPVVTCTGATFVGRVATSLLQAAGLPELVTESLDAYEALALRLATDPTMLAAVRAKLAGNRAVCPLFDTDRFRRHIEAAYSTMVSTWRRGEEPRGFNVDPIEA